MFCWKDEIHLLGDIFKKLFCEMGMIAANRRKCFRTLDNLGKFSEIMDVRDETHVIHTCYAAGWEKYWSHLPGSEEHLLIYQERQLCDDKQVPSVMVNSSLL